jgi:UDP-glucose 4-epimerase
MTTLITGGMGFIGLHTAHVCLDVGEDVAVGHPGAAACIAASLFTSP